METHWEGTPKFYVYLLEFILLEYKNYFKPNQLPDLFQEVSQFVSIPTP